MSERYFVVREEESFGPFDTSQLAALAVQGRIGRTETVRRESDGARVPLTDGPGAPLNTPFLERFSGETVAAASVADRPARFAANTVPSGLTPARALWYLLGFAAVVLFVWTFAMRSKFQPVFIVFALPGVFFLAKALSEFRHVREILYDVPTSKIRSVSVGQVEICGRVVPLEVGEGRVGARASAWRFSAMARLKNPSETPVELSELALPFYVEDDTGRILVVPFGAEWVGATMDKAPGGYWDRSHSLIPGSYVTVVGCAQPMVDDHPEWGLILSRGDLGQPFAIVPGREAVAKVRLYSRMILLAGIGVILLVTVAFYFWLAPRAL